MNLGRSFLIGRLFNIPVRLHWTIFLLIPFIAFQTAPSGYAYENIFWFTILVIGVFGSVLLHEYGHALTARFLGYSTRDIILSPIGGVARLEKFPKDSKHELWITIAGPLVNIALAIIFAFLLVILYGMGFLPASATVSEIDNPNEVLRIIMITNIALFLFNLIPAFPMDGGRILRASIALIIGREKSTKIAVTIGKIMAVLFVIGGIYVGSTTLPIIGIFIFFSAGNEMKQLGHEQRLNDTLVKSLSREEQVKLHIGDTILDAIARYNEGVQRNFLVYNSLGYVAGALPEYYIQQAISSGVGLDKKLGQYMSTAWTSVSGNLSALELFDIFKKQGVAIAHVMDDDGVIIGIIDRNILGNFINNEVDK